MKRVRKILFPIFFVVALAAFSVAVFQLYTQWRQTQDSRELNQLLVEEAVTPVNGTEQEESAPISVDFDRLWEENSDIVAWIYCEDTPINYPVVQAEDNEYYLRRLLNGKYNAVGTIFMDCRCPSDFSGWNSIIYGHYMRNLTMFGSLQAYQDQSYYDLHPVIFLFTPDQTYQIQLIAGFLTTADCDVYYDLPQTQEERDQLLSEVREQSSFVSPVEVQDGERLITLSTCSYQYKNGRFILIGVLRPMEDSK